MASDLPARELKPSLPSVVMLHDYGIYFALAALVVFFSARIPEFRTWDNALLILLQVSVIGIIAVGMTFTIITAGIDLSVGSLLAVAGIMSGLFAQKDLTAVTMTLAFVVPIAVGLLGGAVNGAIIAIGGVNPLIVTLGTLTAFRGFVVWYRVNPIYDLQPYYRVIGQGTCSACRCRWSFCSWWPWWAGSRSASPASAVTSMRSGATARRPAPPASTSRWSASRSTRSAAFASASPAVISTSRLRAAQAISGQGFELQAIAAAVVGGASLFGGRGTDQQDHRRRADHGRVVNGFVMLDVPQPIQQTSWASSSSSRLARRHAPRPAALSREARDDTKRRERRLGGPSTMGRG